MSRPRGRAGTGHLLSRRAALLLAATLATTALAAAGSAQGSRQLTTGFVDGVYTSADGQERDEWFDRTVQRENAGMVRINMVWADVVGAEPLNPRNSNDPSYSFGKFDAAVNEAEQRGLKVLLTISIAPEWADGDNPPPGTARGTWRPDPAKFGDFAHAVASRYDGRVRHYQAWSEPNLPKFITPQWTGGKPRSPGIYEKLLNSFYNEVTGVDPGNKVVSAGTAPYGDPPGGSRMRPLVFLRKLLCLRESLKKGRNCGPDAKLDVLAHHPINTTGGPRQSAFHPDDATTPDVKHVVKALRAAERHHTVSSRGPGNHRPMWVTEFWWESDPPDQRSGVPLQRHARWIEEALYVFWKQGASLAINFQIRDDAFSPTTYQSGTFFRDGDAKPAAKAFGFPFVTDRQSKRRVKAWGKAPEGGELVIQRRRHGNWRPLERFHVGAGKVFTERLTLRDKAELRAKVGGEKSLPWRQG